MRKKRFLLEMVKGDIIHDAYHKSLVEEIRRVLLDCEKLGIFLNKKLASAVVAEKSRRGKMSEIEIKDFVKNLRGLLLNDRTFKK